MTRSRTWKLAGTRGRFPRASDTGSAHHPGPVRGEWRRAKAKGESEGRKRRAKAKGEIEIEKRRSRRDFGDGMKEHRDRDKGKRTKGSIQQVESTRNEERAGKLAFDRRNRQNSNGNEDSLNGSVDVPQI